MSPNAPQDPRRIAGADILPTTADIAPAVLKNPAEGIKDDEILENPLEMMNRRQMMAEANSLYHPNIWSRLRSKTGLSLVVLSVMLIVSATFAISGFGSKGSSGNIGQTGSNLASQLGGLISSDKNAKLSINYDTVLSPGKTLTANGAVIVQNDLANGFSVQNANGNGLLVVDTKNGRIGVGQNPTGTSRLQVNGSVAINGSVLSPGGGYSLSNQGLSFNGVLICTAAGCKSSADQQLNGFARLSGNNSFTGINNFTAAGNVFAGDGSGLSALNASNISTGTVDDTRLSGNVALTPANNNFTGNNTFTAQIQASGGVDASAYSVGGTAGASLTCSSGDIVQNAVITGGIVTGGSCVPANGASVATLQQSYDASQPAHIVLSSASGTLQIQDAATPLGTNLFEVDNNGGGTKYFAVTSAGASVAGTFNATTLQQGGVGVLTQSTNFSGDITGTYNSTVIGVGAVNSSKILDGTITNADIAAAAGITYGKLTLTGGITNTDINAAAGITYGKLNLTGGITNSDVNAAAAIAYSKLSLTGNIVNADISATASISYSKLNLSGSVTNTDIAAGADIAYSKLSLNNSIVNADISSSAAITDNKLAQISSAGKVADTALSANVTKQGNTFNGNNQLVQTDGSGKISNSNLNTDVALTDRAGGQTFTTAQTFSSTITAPGISAGGAALGIGASGDTLNLNGTYASDWGVTNGTNSTTIGFSGTPAANVTYNFDVAAAAGAYTICTTANISTCTVSGNVTTSANGTNGTIAMFTGAQTIANSIITQSGTTVSVAGTLNATTLQQGGTGVLLQTTAFSGDVSGAYNATSVDKLKGTALSINTLANTNLLIYNSTSGNWENHSISGDITVDNTGVATIQPDSVALGTDTAGNYISNFGTLTGLSSSGGGVENATPTLSVTYGSGANSAVEGNTSLTCASGTGNLSGGGNSVTLGAGGSCNNITITNTPTFSSNVTAGFQVQDSISSKNVLAVDTSADKVVLGTAGASGITGTLAFNYSGQTGSVTLDTSNPGSTGYVLHLPAENGTLCSTGNVCAGYQAAVTGGAANQQLSNLSGTVAVNQSLNPGTDNTLDLGTAANSWRTLYADTSVITPTVDTGSAVALNIGSSSSVINLNQSTSLGAGKNLTFAAGGGNFDQSASTGTFATGSGNVSLNGNSTVANNKSFTANGNASFQDATNSATAFQVQNAAGTQIINVDTTTANLISNPSFETNANGWVPDGVATITQVTTQKYIGVGSLQVNTTAAAGDGAKFNFALAPSTTYVFQVYGLITSGSFSTFDMGRAENGSEITCSPASTLLSTSGWTSFGCTFTTGATINNSYLYVKQTDATARTFYIDAVQLLSGTNAVGLPYREATLALNGIVASPVVFQGQANSTTAFQIRDASSNNFLIVDTRSHLVTIGSNSTSYASSVIIQGGTNGASLITNAAASGSTGSISINTGNVTAGAGASGNVSIDVGTSTGTTGTISIGTANASAVNIGLNGKTTTVNGALTVSQGITANGGITVAAGQSVVLTGSGTRPSSPAAGTLYFDTSTNQLIQYNGTKWVSDRSTSTKIVAASNSTQAEKDAADYVATGTGDQATINAALTALPVSGGTVYLMEGTYSLSGSISVPDNTTLIGSGPATVITIPNAQNGAYGMITNSDTTFSGGRINIQNMTIDGNSPGQSSGGPMYGIFINGFGLASREGAKISNVNIRQVYGEGVYVSNSYGTTITGDTFSGSTQDDIKISNSQTATVTGNIMEKAGNTGVYLDTSSNITVSGNAISDKASAGVYMSGATNNTITGNTLQTNNYGIYALFSSNNNVINANKVHDSGGSTSNEGIVVNASNDNNITGNDVTDTSCTTTCYAIDIFGGAVSNYLSSNHFVGDGTNAATINAAGGNTYSNQQLTEKGDASFRNTTDSGTAFQVQNAAGTSLLTVDTTGSGTLTLAANVSATANLDVTGSTATKKGTDYATTGLAADVNFGDTSLVRLTGASAQTIAGITGGRDGYRLTIINAGSNTATLKNNDTTDETTAANLIITGTGSDLSLAAGASVNLVYDSGSSVWRVIGTSSAGGATSTLQQAYNASTTSPQITLNSSPGAGGLVIQDAASTVGNLFTVQNNGGGTNYLNVTNAGISVTGTAVATGNINTSGGAIQTNSVTRIDNSGNLTNIVNLSLSGTISMAGGATGSRPASPTKGTLYYDTTTNQLVQYNGSKWQAPSKSNTFIVAASNSTQAEKDAADYVATGTDDATTINTALSALPAGGGSVYLEDGTYTLGTTAISVPNNTTLAGSGAATVLKFANNVGSSSYSAIKNSDTSTGTHVNIQNLLIDGNKTNQSAGTFTAISFIGMGGSNGSTARDGGKITNVVARSLKGVGISINSSNNNTLSGNTIQGNTIDGIDVSTASYNTLVGNITQGNGSYGIYINASNNTITGNTAQGNTVDGIYLNSASYNTVTGNTAQSNTTDGIALVSSSNNTLSGNDIQSNLNAGITLTSSNKNSINGNTVYGNSLYGIYLSSSSNNIAASNKLTDNGGTASNYSIDLTSSSTSNSLTANDITDTSCTGTCYAININDVGSTGNYLSGNHFLGDGLHAATIRDVTTGGNTYSNQQLTEKGDASFRNATNSAAAFQIQNATGSALFNVDTSTPAISLSANTTISGTNTLTVNGGLTTLGAGLTETGAALFKSNSATGFQVQDSSTSKAVMSVDTSADQVVLGQASSLNGALSFANSAGANTVTLASQSVNPASSVNIFLPTAGASGVQCLQSTAGSTVTSTTLIFNSCAGATISTLQQAYDASVGSTTPEIVLNNGGTDTGGIDIQDGATPVTGNLFDVQNNGGTVNYLAVAATGVTVSNLTSTGIITANGGINVAAGQSLTITGGNFATRPTSPSKGTVYFDSTLNELLTYNGTKWVSAPRSSAFIVAASNSTQAEADAADAVATGTNDQTVINSFFTQPPCSTIGCTVYLLEGTYYLSAPISVPNNSSLVGAGASTIITIPNAQNGSYNLIQNTDTTTGTNVTIQNLTVDGNKANQTSASMNGVYFNGMGSSSRNGGKIENVTIQNIPGTTAAAVEFNNSSQDIVRGNTVANTAYGIYLNSSTQSSFVSNNFYSMTGNAFHLQTSSNNNTIAGNNASGNAASDGLDIYSSSGNTVSGNTFNNNNAGIYLSSSTDNAISGNTTNGNAVAGIFLNFSSQNLITGNTANSNTSYAFYINGSSNNNITSNKLDNSSGANSNNAVYLVGSSTKNSITGNDITDSSCTTTCYAINVSDVGSTGNYIASNHFLGDGTHAASIFDATASGNTYSNQPLSENGDASFRNATNSTTAFQVQNATGTALLKLDTTGSGALTLAANVSATANLDVTGSTATKKGTDYSTTGLSVDTNLGNTSLVRLTGASTQTIAGIANGRDGYRLTIINAAAQSATLKNNDTTDETTAANLIITGTGSDLSLAAGASVNLVYDSGSSLWRVIGTSSAGGATSTLQQSYDASTSSPQITLDSSPGAGGLIIQDAVSPLGTSLFKVQSNGGGTMFFNVSAGNSGSVTVGGRLYTPYIDQSGSAALTIGSGNATAINIGNATNNITTTINGTALVKPTSGHDSTTAFQVQSSSAGNLLTADTTNMRLGVDVTYTPMSTAFGTLTVSDGGSGSLASGSQYYYKVTAIDSAGGETTASSEGTLGTGHTALMITWAGVSGASGYNVYRSTTPGSEVYLTTVLTRSFQDTGSITAGTKSVNSVTANTAYVSTNNSNSSLQLSVGGLGTPTGQVYVSGIQPRFAGQNSDSKLSSPLSVYVQGRYAYVASFADSKLDVYDVSNPAAPTYMGQNSDSNLNSPKSVQVSGHYAYVASNGNNKIVIYDVSNPASPTYVASNAGYDPLTAPTDLYVQGHYLYAVGTSSNSMTTYDISNPYNPVYISSTTSNISSPNSIYVSGRYAYIASFGNNKLTICDVSNPYLPSCVSNSDSNLSGPTDVYVQGRYAYVTNATSGKLAVYDVSNPSNPTYVVSNSDTNLTNPQAITIQGRYAYITGYSGIHKNISVYDVSNPAMPTYVTMNTDTALNGAKSIMVQGRYAYITSQNTNKLVIYDLGGTYTQQLEAGGTQTGTLQVDNNGQVGGDFNIGGALQIGQNLQTTGDLGVVGSANILGKVVIGGDTTQVGTPSTPSVVPQGTGGAQRWDYEITAYDSFGDEGPASPAGTTSSGNATLSASNYNLISWGAVGGASGYNIYRTYATGGSPSSTGWVGTTTGTSFSDTGINVVGTATNQPQFRVLGRASFRVTSDSSTAFQIQGASTSTLFTANSNVRTVGTTGNIIKIGSGSGSDTSTTVLVLDSSSTGALTTNLSSMNGGLYYNSSTGHVNVIENGQVKELCNKTDASCGGNSTTLQQAYDASAAGTTPEIVIGAVTNTTGMDIQNKAGATITGASLLAVRDKAANNTTLGTALFNVSDKGETSIKTTTNSAIAFQVQNSTSTSLLNVDTLNNKVAVGSSSIVAWGGLAAPTSPSILYWSNTGANLPGTLGVTYYYAITALNARGESSSYAEVSIPTSSFTHISAPGAPTAAVNATAGNLNGTYTYKITFVTASGGETTGGTVSGSVSPVNQQVNLTSIPTTSTSSVSARRIYRSNDGGVTYKLVATINDRNVTTSYTDNIADASLGTTIPASNTANTDTNDLRVTWTAVSGAASYNVYRGTSPGGENLLLGNTTSTTFWEDSITATSSLTLPASDTSVALGIGTISAPAATLDVNGSSLFQLVNSTTAFQVQNASGSNLLSVDSTNSVIKIGQANGAPVWHTNSAAATYPNAICGSQDSSAVTYNGNIYVFDGASGALCKYSTTTSTWSSLTSDPNSTANGRMDPDIVTYNGKIYVWGGVDVTFGTTYYNTLDIYDIASGTWSTGTAGGTARANYSSTVYNGKMYIWGGYNGGLLNTMDIYDFSAGTWSTGTAGGTARYNQADAFYNGKWYLYGGTTSGGASKTMDIYDFSAGTWSTGTAGPTARTQIEASVHNDSMYVYAGAGGATTTDVYNFTTSSWSTTSALSGAGVTSNYAEAVDDSHLYIIGGAYNGNSGSNRFFIYSFDSSVTPSQPQALNRVGGTSVIYNGKMYVCGGYQTDASSSSITSLDIYDLATGTWSSGTSGCPGYKYSSSVVYNGKMYVYGGFSYFGGATNGLKIYDLSAGTWSTGTAGGTARGAQSAIVYNGKMYIWGGVTSDPALGSGSVLNTMDIYDFASGTWSTGTAGGTARAWPDEAIYNGKMYETGGTNANKSTYYNTVDIYDFSAGTWSTGTAGGTARAMSASALVGSKLYIWGGTASGSSNAVNTMDIYDVSANSWSTGTAGGTARSGHVGVAYNNALYSWGGVPSSGSSSPLTTMDVYDINGQSPSSVLVLSQGAFDPTGQVGSIYFNSDTNKLRCYGQNTGWVDCNSSTATSTTTVTSLATAYNSLGATGNTITYTTAGAGIVIQDASTPLPGNLFTIQNNAGTANYLTLNLASGTPTLKVYDSTGTNYASISYSGGTAIFAASSGTTQVGSGTGTVSISLTGQTDQLLGQKSFTTASVITYTTNDFDFSRTISAGSGSSLQGSVFRIQDLSPTGNTNATDILLLNQNDAAATGNLINGQVNGVTKFSVNNTGSVKIKNTSSTAFQVQNASSQSVLAIDSSGNQTTLGDSALAGKLAIYNGSNYAYIQAASSTANYGIILPAAASSAANYCLAATSASSGALTWIPCGGGSATANVTLAPEFAGAVMTGVGGSNTGTMTSDYCAGTSRFPSGLNTSVCTVATDEHNYYAWTSTGANSYDIFFRWNVPNDFASFPSSNNSFYGWKTGTAAGDDVKISVYNNSSTACASQSMTNTAGSWQSTTINMSACAPTPGTALTIDVHLSVSASGNFARVGEINLQYNRR